MLKNHFDSFFLSATSNKKAFATGLQQAIDQVEPSGVFAADNLFTFGKNLSFLNDEKFMSAFSHAVSTPVEQSIIWRAYVLCWAAEHGLKLEGDFIECGCYKGTSVRIICDYLDFANVQKKYYLYDLFEHSTEMNHHGMPEHSATLYEKVKARFSDLSNIQITQGSVPEIFDSAPPPAKIAFLHIDMNNVQAELGALSLLFDRLATGGVLVLDDYGWAVYKAQKEAEDKFFAERGYRVLELPTGQGIVIK